MRWPDWLRALRWPRQPARPVPTPPPALDAVAWWETRGAREALSLQPSGVLVDADDHQFRRLSSGQRFQQRDLSPMQQDRMLEIAWYLWETNPFARRLIQLMTDLVVGEGVGLEAEHPLVLEAARKVWDHPVNRLGARVREFHDALALNGELILPVAVNDISGVPVLGFLDPYQVDRVEPLPTNVLVPDVVVLKRRADEAQPQRLRVIRLDPTTDRLEGEVFYFAVNKLPNSMRGRSDYLPVVDWLDLFDQFMFAEIERVRLLSTFVWDLEVKDATPEMLRQRLREIGTPQAGSVFARNQNEKMTPLAPDLDATDRSETARLLTIHIAGSMGMPITWFGWGETNRATIEGQNDVALKTPAARQKQFAGMLHLILRYGVEQQIRANPVLFRGVTPADLAGIRVGMPEIAAKDIARVGQALAQLVPALDTAIQNRTMSRRIATMLQLGVARHLGLPDLRADEVMAEADEDHAAAEERADERLARQRRNPPVPQPPGAHEEAEPAAEAGLWR